MWISYSDSEVNVFHPICEKSLQFALEKNGMDKDYEVRHHQSTGPLEMDFVVQNKRTGKYLCVVEVKRTPADVHSARYQFQAMSYVQMNSGQNEKPFYILTNLEYAFSFRYDSSRPRVFQQMLKPGLAHIGDFSSFEKDDFIAELGNFFSKQLNDFSVNDFDYLITLEEFADHMAALKSESKRWKTHLAVLLYEYIRGAFHAVNRNELKDIRLFNKNVKSICEEGARVNFKDIFTYECTKFEPTYNIDSSMLSNLYDFGEQNINGNSISGILHSIISEGHEHEGEVPTDLELARIVAILAKNSCGELSNDMFLCDPAAGSGNLINEVLKEFNLEPTQIIVNDVKAKLLELLSMRLGLNYPTKISRANSPKIYNEDVADLKQDIFLNVKVIVMNPPFCAGINSAKRRRKIYKSIENITGLPAKTDVGQMPLEAVFLEMVLTLAKPGTTICCVFPKTHLVGRGQESQVIRKLLLNDFGLETVFTYPGDEIFNDVVMDTCVLVGKAHVLNKDIKVISSYDNIPNIDNHKFSNCLSLPMTQNFEQLIPGIVGKVVERRELFESIPNGWRILNSEMVEAITFVDQNINHNNKLMLLNDCEYPIKRGGAGNSGGSDLLFMNTRDDFVKKISHINVKVAKGMRNANLDSINIDSGDSIFFDISLNSDNVVDEIIKIYNSLPVRGGRQQRASKTDAQWKTILKKESNGCFPSASVLIPRAIRTTGKVYCSSSPVFVSTNFVVCNLPNIEEAIVTSTWMSTIFYQLICEVSSKDQEGMRKMEVADILKTYVPKINLISSKTINLLTKEFNKINFLTLNDPEIRRVDEIWAEELFGSKSVFMLVNAKYLLSYLAKKRNP